MAKKKIDKQKIMKRILAGFLAVLMVGGVSATLIMYIVNG